jgi:outer membrane protein OmpA-like peptidoglycan-associated protein
MRNVVNNKRSWISLAVFFMAFSIFIPATNSLAQDSKTDSAQAQAQAMIQNVKEVYFPFNVYSRAVNPAVLEPDAEWLKQNPTAHTWIQAYADIRGDIFYNLVLSYRRAQFVKAKLLKNGVDEGQIGFATGWGKLYPVCQETDESCYQKQRRADIVPPDTM